MPRSTRQLARGLAGLLTATAVLGTAGAANAATTSGRMSGALTFAYHSASYMLQNGATGPDGVGSETGFTTEQPNLSGYTYLSLGDGRGQAVKNNAAHAFNDTGDPAAVFYNSYTYSGCWCGDYDYVPAGRNGDLNVTKNNNAAFKWYPAGIEV